MALPEPVFVRIDWSHACARWLRAGEEYRLRTAAALDGWPCVYCGEEAQAVDHVVPRSRGGTDEPANLVPACRSCNATKSAQSLDGWIENLERAVRRLEGARHIRRLASEGLPFDDWFLEGLEF
jgi:hypothetical protein